MAQHTIQTVSPRASLPPDNRTNIERRQDDANGRTWEDICAAEVSAPESQNLTDEFNPSKTLATLIAADHEHGDRPHAREAGVPLTDGSLRVLRLAQGEGALNDQEKARLDAAEHRAALDGALQLAVEGRNTIAEITNAVKPPDGPKLIHQFLNEGRRDFTEAEREAVRHTLDTATREVVLSDDAQENEKWRRQQVAALQVVAAAIADNTATRAQRIRWSRFNTSRLLNLLKTTRWADLPLDLVKNF